MADLGFISWNPSLPGKMFYESVGNRRKFGYKSSGISLTSDPEI